MKPKLKINKIEFKWNPCISAFKYRKRIPMFSTGGGSYEDFGFPTVEHYQKHFYFFKWCFLTIKGTRKKE